MKLIFKNKFNKINYRLIVSAMKETEELYSVNSIRIFNVLPTNGDQNSYRKRKINLSVKTSMFKIKRQIIFKKIFLLQHFILSK